MSFEPLLNEFLRLSQRLSSLDFTLDENLVELTIIQERQAEIQRQLDQLMGGEKRKLPTQLQTVVEEIIGIETMNVNRMQNFKSELEQTGRDIQTAKRVKSVYENHFLQGFGYFIDSQK